MSCGKPSSPTPSSLPDFFFLFSFRYTDTDDAVGFRAASNFDRPYPGESAAQSLLFDTSGGFSIALSNLYNAGMPIVDDILTDWKKTWAAGIKPTGYAGDILETVPNGFEPDIGTDFGSIG